MDMQSLKLNNPYRQAAEKADEHLGKFDNHLANTNSVGIRLSECPIN